jgi:predicted RNase H-like nuclease
MPSRDVPTAPLDTDDSFVVGIDGTAVGWVAVALRSGAFDAAVAACEFGTLVSRFPHAHVVAVDMPIGIPERGVREADVAARRVLRGARCSSVFVVPPRAVLEADDYAAALRRCEPMGAPGVSRQAFGLRRRIFEVDEVAATMPHLVEVHPEVSFHALNWGPLGASKHSSNGWHERRHLLARAGIHIPGELPEARGAGPDDVVDAAVAAWTALRVYRKTAGTLPVGPPIDGRGRPVAIWF